MLIFRGVPLIGNETGLYPMEEKKILFLLQKNGGYVCFLEDVDLKLRLHESPHGIFSHPRNVTEHS